MSFIKLQYKATPAFTALIHLGYYTNGQLEFSHDLGTFDRENQVAAAINLQFQF
ncbi:MAG: hypothetical protein HAW66_08300 [Shewanella sp.]|nr:hypothetical protein [Shewanella sp.]